MNDDLYLTPEKIDRRDAEAREADRSRFIPWEELRDALRRGDLTRKPKD